MAGIHLRADIESESPRLKPHSRLHVFAIAIVGTLMLLESSVSAQNTGPARGKGSGLDILVVAPHPDDEALGCTGVMLQAIERRQRVGVVLVTNGDGFPKAAAVVAKKPADELVREDYVKLARIRQQHSVGAMSRIGIRAGNLMFLGYPDSGLKPMYEAKQEAVFRQKFTGHTETYGALIGDYHSTVHG